MDMDLLAKLTADMPQQAPDVSASPILSMSKDELLSKLTADMPQESEAPSPRITSTNEELLQKLTADMPNATPSPAMTSAIRLGTEQPNDVLPRPSAAMTAEGMKSRVSEATRQLATEQDPTRRATLEGIAARANVAEVAPESALMSMARSGGAAVAPSVVGMTAGGRAAQAFATIAPGAWKLLSPAVALVVGGGAGWATGKAQEALGVEVFGAEKWNDMIAQEAANRKAHPLATAVGELGPSIATFKPLSLKSWRNVGQNVRAIVNAVKAKDAAKLVAIVDSAAGKKALNDTLNVALGGTVNATQEAIAQVRTGNIDPLRIAIMGIGGGILADPNRLGRKLMGTPVTPELLKDVEAVVKAVSEPPPLPLTAQAPQKGITPAVEAPVAEPTRLAEPAKAVPSQEQAGATISEPVKPVDDMTDPAEVRAAAKAEGVPLEVSTPKLKLKLKEKRAESNPVRIEESPEEAQSHQNADREATLNLMGMESEGAPAKLTHAESLAKAEQKMAENPMAAQELEGRLLSDPDVRVNVDDEAMLARHWVELKNKYNRVVDAMTAARERGDDNGIETARAAQTAVEAELAQFDQAARVAGTTSARAMRMRQQMLKEDYSAANLVRRFTAAKGGKPPTPAESAKLQKMADDYAALTQKLTEENNRLKQEALDRTIADMDKTIQKEEKGTAKTERRKARQAKEDAFFEQWRKEAVEGLQKRGYQVQAGADPTVLVDVAKLGAYYLHKGIRNFDSWSSVILKKAGDWVKPHLQDLWGRSNSLWMDTRKKLSLDDATAKLKEATTPDEDGMPADKAAQGRAIQNVAFSLFESGVRDRNQLVAETHRIVKDSLPDMTPDQVRDAISGYGEYKQPTKDVVLKDFMDIKAQLRKLAQLQAATAGQHPLKTGKGRHEPSAEVRRLTAEVNEAMKKLGLAGESDTKTLRAPVDRIKTHLENQIADLDNAIASKQPLPKQTKGVEYPDVLKEMVAERDALRVEYDKMFKKELTDQERLALAIRYAEKNAATWNKKLLDASQGVVAPKPGEKPLPPDARLAELRQQAADARNLVADMKKIGTPKKVKTPAEIEAADLAAAERRLNELNFKLSQAESGQFPDARRAIPRTTSAEVQSLKAQQKVVADRIAAIKKASFKRTPTQIEQARLASEEKKLAKLNERLQQASEGEFPGSVRRIPEATSAEVAELKAQQREVSKLIANMRKVAFAGPKRTPEEIRLSNFKRRAENRIVELQRRMNEGDFGKRVKPEQQLDAEAFAIQKKLDDTKQSFDKMVWEEGQKNRSALRRTFDTILAPWRAVTDIITSFDMSPFGRQAGLSVLGHPFKATGALFRALKAVKWDGGKNFENLSNEIKNYPNYKSYASEMLDPNRIDFASVTREQLWISQFLDKVYPGLKMSKRGFAGFLNLYRAQAYERLFARHNKLTSAASSPEMRKQLLSNVLILTGKGEPGKYASAVKGLGYWLWAPQLYLSRLQLLAAYPILRKGSPQMKRIMAEEYVRSLAGAATVMTLALAAGAKISYDSNSSKFGLIQFGEHYIDIWAGAKQFLTLLSQVVTGRRTKATGQTAILRKQLGGRPADYGESVMGPIADFARAKLNPPISQTINVLDRQNILGEETTPWTVFRDSIAPLSMRDIVKNMREDGIAEGTIFTVMNLLGWNVQHRHGQPQVDDWTIGFGKDRKP